MRPNLVLNEDDKKRRFRKYKNPEELNTTDQCGTLTNNQKRQLMGSLPKTKKSKNSSSTISEKTDSDLRASLILLLLSPTQEGFLYLHPMFRKLTLISERLRAS